MSSNVKRELVNACESYLEERIQRIEVAIKDLEDALKLETKCSMGDKYETGRAMLHLEFEKLSAQYEEYRKLGKTLSFVKSGQSSETVGFGSVVYTSSANYFISIPAGEIIVEKKKFYAIGANAPIARILMGKKEGDRVVFNGQELQVLKLE